MEESLDTLVAPVLIGALRLHSFVRNIKPIEHVFTVFAGMSEGHEGHAGAFLAVSEENYESRKELWRAPLHHMSGNQRRTY